MSYQPCNVPRNHVVPTFVLMQARCASPTNLLSSRNRFVGKEDRVLGRRRDERREVPRGATVAGTNLSKTRTGLSRMTKEISDTRLRRLRAMEGIRR